MTARARVMNGEQRVTAWVAAIVALGVVAFFVVIGVWMHTNNLDDNRRHVVELRARQAEVEACVTVHADTAAVTCVQSVLGFHFTGPSEAHQGSSVTPTPGPTVGQ